MECVELVFAAFASPIASVALEANLDSTSAAEDDNKVDILGKSFAFVGAAWMTAS